MEKQIVIEQYLGNAWIRLIALDTEGGPTEEDLTKTVNKLTEKIHNSESVFFVIEEGTGVIINKKNGPIRLSIAGTKNEKWDMVLTKARGFSK